MNTLAVLHATQLVTLAGEKRPRVGEEMNDLAIVRDGEMLVQDGRIVKTGASSTAIAWTNFEMRAQGATYEDSEKIMEFGAAFCFWQ